MREIYKTFKCFFYCCVCFCLFALFSLEVHAQAGQCLTLGCSTGVSFGSTQSTTSTTFVNSVSGTWAGEYNTYNVTSGMQYEWSLCTADGAVVGTNTDSQLSLRRNDTNAALCYSDDLCGAHAKILWTATFTGVVRVYIHRYNCTSLSTSHTVRWRCVSCGGGGGGCVGPPYCDQTQPGPGYTLLPACQTSICAADSYCCSTQWDSICATAASTNANCVNCRSTCSGGGGCTYTVPFSGSNSITTCTGTICEHAGTANYSNNANGFTIINPATAGNMVRLTFTSFSLECCCDFVTVFNGAGTGGTTLFNGNCTSLPPVLTSTVGPLTIRFTSDFSVVSSGFSANISCVPPPCTLTANAGSNVSICNGSSTVLTGSSSGISPTYSWSPSGSLNNPNISNPTASPSTTTTYTLTVTEGACTATSQVTVTVNPSPSAPTSVTASPSNHCPGGGVTQLNATSSGNSIRWFTVPVGGSSLGTSGSGVNFPVSTSSSTTYYAEALTGAGCISSTRTAVTVTVGDAIPPTINCPSTVTVGNMAGQCAATVNFITPTGTDNCPGATTIQIGGLPSGSSFPVGSTTNTFLVQAGNGQTAQCSFNVVVNDTQAPSANCQNATVSLGPGGIASVSASQINNGSVDNCGITGTSLSGTTNYNCTHIGGTFTVTLQVNDAAGNTATCSATVTVNDNNGYCCDAPQAICHPSPSVILNGSGTATLTPSQVDNGSTADCGLQSIQVSPTNFNCAHVGFPQTVVLTVTDIYNNTSTCQTTLTVADNSAAVCGV
ncbi:MAG: HYR domain-containing protein [Sphingobacteriales bacterium]|nr:MAG: HYR domain-containing protein [Sphingobacteriales bacterium]